MSACKWQHSFIVAKYSAHNRGCLIVHVIFLCSSKDWNVLVRSFVRSVSLHPLLLFLLSLTLSLSLCPHFLLWLLRFHTFKSNIFTSRFKRSHVIDEKKQHDCLSGIRVFSALFSPSSIHMHVNCISFKYFFTAHQPPSTWKISVLWR